MGGRGRADFREALGNTVQTKNMARWITARFLRSSSVLGAASACAKLRR
jgi:hypothetical protein